MGRILAFIYGIISYAMFLGSFCYAIAFVGDFYVPKTINTGEAGDILSSLLINTGLLGLFAIQHSGMARPGFKKWWTKVIPKPIERSTYVLLASASLILLYWLWQPLTATIWSVEHEIGRWILWGLFGLGWGLVLYTTFLISHAHLFGLTQVRDFLNDRYLWEPDFQTPGLYRYVRHPMMLGFFIAFWAIPEMTAGHLLFSVATTGYILIALRLEENDLVHTFGVRYRKYRERVPMFIPRLSRKSTIGSKEQNTEPIPQSSNELNKS